jgi:hypothetical protein
MRLLRWHAPKGSRARHLQLQAHREGCGGSDGRVLHLLVVLVLLLHCCSLRVLRCEVGSGCNAVASPTGSSEGWSCGKGA